MVKQMSSTLDATFSALSDPTRRAILDRLGKRECTVTELAKPFPISLPAISKHLSVLERAGLITRKRMGRRQMCRLKTEPMRRATEWLERYRDFWDARLDALDAHLRADKAD
jgi:DNA-binding transcriptional ArsR family regulator